MTEREDEAHRRIVGVRTIATFVRVHVELGIGLLQHTLKSKNRGTCSRDSSSTQSSHGVYIGSKVGGIGEYHRNVVVVGSWCAIIILDHERHNLKSKNCGTCSSDSSIRKNHGVYSIGSKVGIER